MKRTKTVAMIFCTAAVLSLTACSTRGAGGGTDSGAQPEASSGSDSAGSASGAGDASAGLSGAENILIAYFTVPETDGVDTVAGASRVAVDGTVMGNNEYIANLIQQETGGDLFAIETVQEYPGTHDALLEFAYNEMMDDARPELASQIEDLDSYDTIFLESYDLGGKTIVPFTTHGGSGFSRTIQTIEELQPDASLEQNDGASDSSDASGTPAEGGDGILIAYFTAAENSGVDAEASASYSEVDGEAKGRMQALAEMIQAETGGDLFSIQTEETYPADGGELIDYAAEEQDEDARPELGSRFSGTIETIAELEPDAEVIEDGFTVNERDVPDAAGDIADWLEGLGY